MIFRDKHEPSIIPKSVIVLALSTSIFISGYLMFSESHNMIDWLEPYKVDGDVARNILILSCFIIYFLRLLVTLFFFYRRKMYWIEAFAIVNIMPWIFLYVTWIGGRNHQPVGLLELCGLLLFLLGSYLNTTSEYFRYAWKQKEENKGHLYTNGLFKHARHINYLGDTILFTGLTLVSLKAILLIIPISMALVFTLILIPLKESYLKRKYGNEFNDYANRTKRFIPMVY